MVKTCVIKLRVTEGLNTRDQIALDAFHSLGNFSNDDTDGNENENVKTTIGLLSKTTSLHLHRAFFVFLHFFAVTARLRRENAYFLDIWRT